MMDAWTEFLCLRAVANKPVYELGVCGITEEGEFDLMHDTSVTLVNFCESGSLENALTALGWTTPIRVTLSLPLIRYHP